MCIDLTEKKLIIDSSKRNSSETSSTNFQINLVKPLKVKLVKLENFQIPLTWYNITSSNGSFTINDGVDDYDLSLTGRYTDIQALLTDIKTELDNSGAGFTFTVSQTNNGKITVSSTDTYEIVFVSGQLWDLLGCASGQTLTGSSSYTFSYVPKIYSIDKYLMLKIDYLEGNVEHINNIQDSTSFIIDLPNSYDQNLGDMIKINYEQGEQMIKFNSPVNLQSFRISLHNENNEIIDLNNNDFYFTLRVFE